MKPTAASRKNPERADAPAPVVSTRQKQELRARAHHLEPIVQIGHGGVHDAAIDAVRRALLDHELIKVRLHEPEDKRGMADALAEGAKAALCGLVGHTVILYKPKPASKAKAAPKARPFARSRPSPRAKPKRRGGSR